MLDEKTKDLIERTSILQDTLAAVIVTLACDDEAATQADGLEGAVGIFQDVDSYVLALCQRVDRLRAEEGLEQC